MRALLVLSLCLASPAAADTLVAGRTIRAATVIAADDLALSADDVPGALQDPSDAIGLETRAALYAGRPIRPGDLRPAAVVERNQIVQIAWHRGSLAIRAEGRALGRGAPGEEIRVMNLASRTTITGTVGADAAIHVGAGGSR